MKPVRLGLPSITVLALLAGASSALAQVVPRPAPRTQDAPTVARPDEVVMIAVRSNPVTASYPIFATLQKGKVILAGRVGSKQVHDAAVRMAIDIGVPFRDDLVIDTGMAHMVAQTGGAGMAGAGPSPGMQASRSVQAVYPYVYPPPLFARLDDPFFGFVPPLLSFPPWWSRGPQTGSMVQPRMSPSADPNAAQAPVGAPSKPSNPNGAPIAGWRPLELDPVKGQVDIVVDISGQVFLRGSVLSEEAAREIVESARSVPGVSAVYSELQVVPRRANPDDQPPPPPVPIEPNAPRPDGPAPALAPASAGPAPAIVPARAKSAGTPIALDSQALTRRVVGSLERRPPSNGLPVKVRSTDGVITLSGQVPSAYEAMLVYRAVEQTPGVREIIDRLEFTVPDEDHPNPLLRKGPPEDVERYLASQIRRHVGDLAHIDRIQARGNLLEIRGTIDNAADQERLLAILRSISVLHGFQLETKFIPQ
jgi:osmotically-inducible protein OsmY